jgi:hypothetical protein
MKTVLASLRIAALLLGSASLATSFGATEDVTIHNDSSGWLIVRNLSIGGSFHVTPGTHTFTLNDAHSFSVAQYNVGGDPGHEFSFSGGQVVAGGNAPLTNEYFNVSANDIYVSGIKFTARLVTDTVGNGYQLLYGNSGVGMPTDYAYLATDYLAYLLPADGNYNGTFDLQFFAPVANPATLVIGTNGVLSLTGTGASYVASGPNSILATLSNGNVLELTAIPEPSAMAFLALGGILSAWRRRGVR